MIRIASIGECMIELRHVGAAALDLAFGGDSFNTAAYLARVGSDRLQVDYVTALGDDPYSDAMLATFARERVGTALVARLPGRLPGLYAIRVDAHGERSFYYWRREAAARSMLDGEAGDRLAQALPGYDWIYLSGITLSILAEPAQDRLFDILQAARRRGARIAFDTNYRPRGWPDRTVAQATIARAYRHADVALPTFPDEQALFGDADPQTTARRIKALGASEVAVKNGGEPVHIMGPTGLLAIAVPPVARVVDTTAAGDAFNAGYLAARIHGTDMQVAVQAGCRLAGAVIGERGAVIASELTPDLSDLWC